MPRQESLEHVIAFLDSCLGWLVIQFCPSDVSQWDATKSCNQWWFLGTLDPQFQTLQALSFRLDFCL
jgi:hypothetical protein